MSIKTIERNKAILDEFVELVEVQKFSHKDAVDAIHERHKLFLSRANVLKITAEWRDSFPEAINSLRGAKSASIERQLNEMAIRIEKLVLRVEMLEQASINKAISQSSFNNKLADS